MPFTSVQRNQESVFSLTKREGLSAPCLCASNEVPSLTGRLEHGLLDSEQGLDAPVVERPDSLGAQTQVGNLSGGGCVGDILRGHAPCMGEYVRYRSQHKGSCIVDYGRVKLGC